MDPILQVLLSWQFVLFSLAVATVMYVLRIVVEYIMTSMNIDPKKPKWWNDLALPILPVFVGTITAVYLKSFPYPDGLVTTGSRVVFGLVAGLLSTLVYRVFKAILYQKIQGLVQTLPGAVPNPAEVTTTVTTPTPTTVTVSTPNLPPRGQL
jgi:hypothetical protein